MKNRLMFTGTLLLFTWAVTLLILIFFTPNVNYRAAFPLAVIPFISAGLFLISEFYVKENKENR